MSEDGGYPCVIKNVKIRFSISPRVREQLNTKIAYWKKACEEHPSYFLVKTYPNYIVFKNSLVYTIFTDIDNSYYKINITGINSISRIAEAVGTFCHHFNVLEENIIGKIYIDSIFACGKFIKCVNLRLLMRQLNGSADRTFRVKFNCETAPAAYCRHKTLGMIAVFRTGKYLILGAKCQTHVNQLVKEMDTAIQTL